MLEKLKKCYFSECSKEADGSAASLYYVDEIARLTVYGCDEREEIYKKCADTVNELFAFSHKELGKATGTSRSQNESVMTSRAAYFCKAVCGFSEEKGEPISESELLFSMQSDQASQYEGGMEGGFAGMLGNSVAYVRNAVSDEAFRQFSAALKGATVSYTSGFAAACEEVYYGRVRYCILPYETSEEGTLSGFMKMIRKYELYTECVCSVRGERSSTRFVLLSRQAGEPLTVKGAKRYLKVELSSSEHSAITKLMTAASALSIAPVKLQSIPVSWDDGRYVAAITFDLGTLSASPLLLYLAICVPECSDVSVYTEV